MPLSLNTCQRSKLAPEKTESQRSELTPQKTAETEATRSGDLLAFLALIKAFSNHHQGMILSLLPTAPG